MSDCDCMIPYLEGVGQHSPGCAIFKKEPCPFCGCPGEQFDGHVCEDFVSEAADGHPEAS